jgi:hypothetical protein
MGWDVEVKPEGSGGNFEIPQEGNWAARVAALIDVGHHEAHSQDGSAYDRRTAIIAFQLAAKKKDGSPFYIARTLTLSLATNTNLYSIVKSLAGEKKMGEKFDPSWIANKGCLVQVTHTTKSKRGGERTYANIEAVTALPQGMTYPTGNCIVWTVSDRAKTPLPDVSFLPPLYHEASQKMQSVAAWVALSTEAFNDGNTTSGVSDSRIPARNGPSQKPSAPVTQEEADIPF